MEWKCVDGIDSGWGPVTDSCEHGVLGTDVSGESYVSIVRDE
jgi:hypothetical protein